MKRVEVAVIHFQPLEKYPPVMNLLRFLQPEKMFNIQIYSSNEKVYRKNVFKVAGIRIHRNGVFYKKQSPLLRYINYIKFNFFTFFRLVFTNPSSVICYETFSVFPVYFYKKIFTSTKIYIHYHEYTSPTEIKEGSFYLRWLNSLEKKIFLKTYWISHTNAERLTMFKTDNEQIVFSNLEILPNYPPSAWYKKNKYKSLFRKFPVKFVYVGALSMETMYTMEFAQWIKELNGRATWDIYSGNYQENVMIYIKNLHCPFINFKGEVSYWELPKVLREYDVGLVLYNGHIPNYIYNVPNKVFEYHACNLDVWFSKDIKGSLPYIKKYTYPKILEIDFKNLSNLDLPSALNRQCIGYHSFNYSAEQVFKKLVSALQ